jgi:hypothetical protein
MAPGYIQANFRRKLSRKLTLTSLTPGNFLAHILVRILKHQPF